MLLWMPLSLSSLCTLILTWGVWMIRKLRRSQTRKSPRQSDRCHLRICRQHPKFICQTRVQLKICLRITIWKTTSYKIKMTFRESLPYKIVGMYSESLAYLRHQRSRSMTRLLCPVLRSKLSKINGKSLDLLIWRRSSPTAPLVLIIPYHSTNQNTINLSSAKSIRMEEFVVSEKKSTTSSTKANSKTMYITAMEGSYILTVITT